MRSSKSRSRSKQNRPRTLGNIINRVFDSSGPEGKVRGTPQQIIEKYQMLARDAQLSNDRVAAENFLQHAEHYTRLLAEAQREMAAEQEARQQYQQQNGQNQNGNYQNGNRDRAQGERDSRPERQDRGDYRPDYRNDNRPESQPETGYGPAPDAFEVVGGEEEGGLVDLPEAPRPQQNSRRVDNRPPRDPQNQPRRDDSQRREDAPRREETPRREERPVQEQPPRRREPVSRGEPRSEPRAEPKKIEIVVQPETPVAADPVAAAAPAEAKPAPRPRTRRPAAPKVAVEAGAAPDKPEAAE
ncbi:DUF4167 domain-containing protein [Paracoccaceae bacterium]